MSRPISHRSGFTLLELLVALSIMLAAFTVIWNTFSTTIKAWTRGSDLLDDLHHGDFVMEQLVSALRSAAFFNTAPDKYGFWLDDNGSGEDARDEISWVTSGTAFLPPDSPLAGGLHRIAITIDNNEDGDPAVAVRVWPHLAKEDDIEMDDEVSYVSTEIKGMDCRVYVKDESANESDISGDWKDEWEDTNSIPRLVEITLYMEPIEEYGDPVELKRLIEIPVAPPLDGPAPSPDAAPAQGGEKPEGTVQPQQEKSGESGGEQKVPNTTISAPGAQP